MKPNQEFTNLLNIHEGILQKVSRMYTDTRTDREDLRQEIAYQLWKAWPNFRGESKASTWVYRVALNTAITRVRKRKTLIDYLPFAPDRGRAGGPSMVTTGFTPLQNPVARPMHCPPKPPPHPRPRPKHYLATMKRGGEPPRYHKRTSGPIQNITFRS